MSIDLLVVGGGAAGMAAARTAVRGRRRRVVLVQDGAVGGDCTFTGCVPSKTLIESAAAGLSFAAAMDRVRATVADIAATETADVLRGEGIEVVEGRAVFDSPHRIRVGSRVLRARRVVLALGSRPAVPPIPGLEGSGFLTNDTVWDLQEAPRRLAVLGGGPIGCELSQALSRLGVSVSLVEAGSRLLTKEEPEAGAVVEQALRRDGVTVRLGTSMDAVRRDGAEFALSLGDGSLLRADALLVAVGRRPPGGFDPGALGLRTDERGWISVDDRMATTVARVWAAGDINGRLPFTHAADEMGRIAAVNAARGPLRMRLHADAVPWVTFTTPEVARVGLTEAQAAPLGARVAYLPMSAVDRARAAGQTDGFLQLIAAPRRGTGFLAGGRLVGATVVASRAGEMIAELALAVRTGMFTARLAQTVHAYPTWSTSVRSAAAQFLTTVDGRTARPAEA